MCIGTKADMSLMLLRTLMKDSVADVLGANKQSEAGGVGIV